MNDSNASMAINGTQTSCPQPSVSYIGNVMMLITYSFILFAALLGNGAVCLVIAVNSSTYLKNTINYFLLNIAITDLAIPIVVVTRKIYEIATQNEKWRVKGHLGNFLCKLVFFLSDMSPIVSILSLVFMSLDRLVAVVFPLLAIRFSQSNARKYLLVLSWVIASVFCSPHFYTFQLDSNEYCISKWDPAFDHQTTRYGYSATTIVLFIFIPFLLLTIVYSLILVRLGQRTKSLGKTETQRQKDEKNRRNITYLSLTIVVLFGICWLPLFMDVFVYNFIWEWDPTKAPCKWYIFHIVAEFMAHSNAAINPFVYFLFLQKFREGLLKLFCRFKHRAQFSDTTGTSLQTKFKPEAVMRDHQNTKKMAQNL